MDIREVGAILEHLQNDLNSCSKSFDSKLDSVSSFICSELDDVVSAINDAANELDKLQKQIDEMEEK